MFFKSLVCRVALPMAVVGLTVSVVALRPAVAAPAKVQSVSIKGFAFVPQIIKVAPGTTITWTNADEDPHTVVANDKSFHSAAMDTDDKFTFTFTKPGTYAYFCSLHPHMTGKVVVE
jgi:plastocyanin